jgi:hypothetical protein
MEMITAGADKFKLEPRKISLLIEPEKMKN